MDIKYIGSGKPANKKVTYYSDSQKQNVTVNVRFEDMGSAYIAIDVPKPAAERILKSPNFVELKSTPKVDDKPVSSKK